MARFTSTSPFSTVKCAPAVTRTARVNHIERRGGDVIGRIVDCLFPRICIGCGRIGDYVCSSCAAELPWLSGPLCPHCGQPQPSGMLCPSCAAQVSTIAAIRSVFRFEGVARVAVHELKYRNLRAIAPTLASFLAAYPLGDTLEPDVVVPVPLHPSRRRRRGYNQAELLAREFGRARGLPVDSSALVRIVTGRSQVRTASRRERSRNVTDAFACTERSFSDKRILLVDDVCTTGATIEACGVALRAAGASQVVGLTVARQV